LLAGAVNATEIDAFPAVPITLVGAPGTVAGAVGVTATEAADAGPVPTLLVAVTVQVYESPLVRSVTTMGLEAPDAVPELEPLVLETQAAV